MPRWIRVLEVIAMALMIFAMMYLGCDAVFDELFDGIHLL